jgi:hypothetical protein
MIFPLCPCLLPSTLLPHGRVARAATSSRSRSDSRLRNTSSRIIPDRCSLGRQGCHRHAALHHPAPHASAMAALQPDIGLISSGYMVPFNLAAAGDGGSGGPSSGHSPLKYHGMGHVLTFSMYRSETGPLDPLAGRGAACVTSVRRIAGCCTKTWL